MKYHFTEENILRLFGNEAAENEGIDRLREYYVKGSVFKRVVSDTPLRILVGHKGIGKSALIKVAIAEDNENHLLSILIRPDDIISIASEDKTLLELIKDWKEGLTHLLTVSVLNNFGVKDSSEKYNIKRSASRILSIITDSLKTIHTNIDIDPLKRTVLEQFLKKNQIIVYLDDLDRGWEGRRVDIKRISALLNAVRDLSCDNPGLIFRIALRSDVYFLVRTSDESTDKIESSVIWCSWTNHEIMVLLIKRIQSFLGNNFNESDIIGIAQSDLASLLDDIYQPRFTGRGLWQNAPMYRVLMSVIRKRPRDLIKLCTAAARDAYSMGSTVISTKNLQNVFEDYSQGRTQDTINEYRTELADLERLIMGMKPNKKEKTTKQGYHFTTEQLLMKLNNIMQGGKFYFANNKEADNRDLANFLYKINFLTARKELASGVTQRKYFEESRYLSSKFADFGYEWEIHPAYRWALQPDSIESLFESIRLSADDIL